MDVSKKKKHAEPESAAGTPSSNYMNLEPAAVGSAKRTTAPTDTGNYMNLEFSESLCLYENAKHVLTKAGLNGGGGHDACDKCGHQRAHRCTDNGDDKSDDYMTMEPVNGRMSEVKRNLFPGYLPMCPAGNCGGGNKQRDMLKNIMNRGLAEKSASIPSLNECRPSVAEAAGDVLSAGAGNSSDGPRKRSSSAGSAAWRDVDGREATGDSLPSVCGDGGSDTTTAVEATVATSSDDASSADSVSSQTVGDKTTRCSPDAACGAQSDDSGCGGGSTVQHNTGAALVHIRRSSSVPCKNNRDSSSSNDSGVSTGSLRYRGADFAEFELPLTTAMSTVRHRRTITAAGASGDDAAARPIGCVHGSLPRRSKSTDRLKELSFRFQRIAGPVKSSSAGAEVPVCMKKGKNPHLLWYLKAWASSLVGIWWMNPLHDLFLCQYIFIYLFT